jgi:glycosidase
MGGSWQMQTGMYEFHVSRRSRDRYLFDQSLFSLHGNVIFANFLAARLFAQKMNAKRDLLLFPERTVRAGQINAMGLIDEILHFVVGLYRQQVNPQVMVQALDWLDERLGRETVDQALRRFADEYPPLAVYRREIPLEAYLTSETDGVPNRQIVVEELLLLWLANENPAFSPFLELFDDTALVQDTAYPQIIAALQAFFETQPPFGPDAQNLVEMLRSPAIAVPHSLTGQLEYIRQRWATLLGQYLFRLLNSLDLIREEDKVIFLGPGLSRVYDFSGLAREAERFSPDREWMPSLVLIAKNAYVWLDQLSKKYRQSLYRLDHVPDEELDQLARWGFSGLWLIGLWERSQASKRIKQLRGNPEAVASAYSLFDYGIAGDLGGEEAYANLRDRASQRGIRLASDMVPNHMGIDSRWVIEHPDWFISLDHSPFPSYTFTGPNLSWDDRVAIYLDDHYYDSSDAAVVFKRVDQWSGNTRYIYHGNDGTSFPWNDTAQLNYLIAEVREAVIQTILHVARKFPIIRFDAAMTLAKKHFQRLWFPEPGTGGAIPSRAEHGLTRKQFDALFPTEFWREVVDRVAVEVPDTLLLAEAFWLMEGYFVRTLGMHRVYNSAFMNMLRDEKNQEYRLVIKNTLEFDPEILKRYVNFMSNPDERTAVDQFGTGDKYFGVCTLMATMPGLPMFGHGQIEGYTEKYGMEFRRAYWDEWPDRSLVERHEREIFPLLRRRYLFAEVRDFLLYDFYTPDGSVNEDVFAYSNRAGAERGLVVYHNRYAETRGWIRTSAAYSVKTGQDDERSLVQKSLGEGLGLQRGEDAYTIFRDHVTGLEYIRSNQEIHEQGLFVELGAYRFRAFMDFREVQDNDWHQYAQLAAYLAGRGVPSIDEVLKEIFLQPVHFPYRELVNAGSLRWLIDHRLAHPDEEIEPGVLDEVEQKALHLGREINALTQAGRDEATLRAVAAEIRRKVRAILELPVLKARYDLAKAPELEDAVQMMMQGTRLVDQPGMPGEPESLVGDGRRRKARASPEPDLLAWGAILSWAVSHTLGKILGEDGSAERSRSWIDEWLFGRIIATALQGLGIQAEAAWRGVELVRVLTSHQHPFEVEGDGKSRSFQILETWLQDADIQQFLHINRYQGVLWFNQESFDQLLSWMLAIATIQRIAETGDWVEAGGAPPEQQDGREFVNEVRSSFAELVRVVRQLQQAEAGSEYQVERLLQAVKG